MPTPPTNVVVHPLVLLSVVDHYNRVAKDSRRRVVGVLLGETWKGSVDITNSFAGTRVIHQRMALNRVVVGSTFQLPAAAAIPARMACVFGVACVVLPPVPFEEESKDPTSWYLDHSYLESMAFMFKKINGKVYQQTLQS